MRAGVEEVLAQQIRVGAGLLDRGPDAVGDLLAVALLDALAGEHVGHIHPPAVRAEGRAQPAPEDGVGRLEHAPAQLEAAVVEFGQRAHPEPGFVLVGVLAKGEEPGFDRVGIGLGGEKPGVARPAVIGHDIEQIAHPAPGELRP